MNEGESKSNPETVHPALAALPGLKPGYKSTEFYLLAAAVLLVSFGPLAAKLPPEYAAIVTVLAPIAYQFLRNRAKGQAGDHLIALAETLHDLAQTIAAPPQPPPPGGAPATTSGAHVLPLIFAAASLLVSGCSPVLAKQRSQSRSESVGVSGGELPVTDVVTFDIVGGPAK